MSKKWQFISLWMLTLIGMAVGIPILSQTLATTVGLPFILNDMLVGFFVGTIIGAIQSYLLKPYATLPHWRSNTAFAAVGGAIFVGGMTIFIQAASAFPNNMVVSPAFIILAIGIAQSLMLPKDLKQRHIWLGLFMLLSAASAAGLWLPVIGISLLIAISVHARLPQAEKQKNDINTATLRLSDDHLQSEQQSIADESLHQQSISRML